jgi:5-keto 4-deoxyuronate isomerase
MKKNHRQGDLLFVPISSPVDGLMRKDFRKNGVIREGEATGHHHRVEDLSTADVFLPQNGMPIVNVGGKGAVIVHPEHKPIRLEPNTIYAVHLAREHDPMSRSNRTVAD